VGENHGRGRGFGWVGETLGGTKREEVQKKNHIDPSDGRLKRAVEQRKVMVVDSLPTGGGNRSGKGEK